MWAYSLGALCIKMNARFWGAIIFLIAPCAIAPSAIPWIWPDQRNQSALAQVADDPVAHAKRLLGGRADESVWLQRGGRLIVDWGGAAAFSSSEYRTDFDNVIARVTPAIFAAHPGVNEIHFGRLALYELPTGHREKKYIANAIFTRDEAGKINWRNFQPQNVSNVVGHYVARWGR